MLPGILKAVELYSAKMKDETFVTEKGATLRILCLTDGEDRSPLNPIEVAEKVRSVGGIVDVVSIRTSGTEDAALRLCAYLTGGLCFVAPSDAMSMVSLFQREAFLRVRSRLPPIEANGTPVPPPRLPPLPLASAWSSAPSVPIPEYSVVPDVAQNSKLTEKATSATRMSGTPSRAAAGGIQRRVRRILDEFRSTREIAGDDVDKSGFQVFMVESDLSFWKILLKGPTGSPYVRGHFALSVEFPADYPDSPPAVRFMTRIFHCNISDDGRICHDVLGRCWVSSVRMTDVIADVLDLMTAPNKDDALDAAKGALLCDNKAEYINQATKWTVDHASKSVEELKRQHNLE